MAARRADRRADLLDRAEEVGAEVAATEAEAGQIGGEVIEVEARPSPDLSSRPPMLPGELAARAMAGIRQGREAGRAAVRQDGGEAPGRVPLKARGRGLAPLM